MSNSKKRTIGILSVIVLLCACLFFVTLAGNTREKAYAATASSVDLSQTANYTIGEESELDAFTSIDGATATTIAGIFQFSSAAKQAPTAVEGGLEFTIPQGFKISYPVKFAQPLFVEGGVEKLTLTMYCDLSPADTYGSLDGGNTGVWGTKGVFVYPLGATGAEGEGAWLPFTITQREEIKFDIVGSVLDGFKNADGEIEGFIIGSCNGGSFSHTGNESNLHYYKTATVLVKSAAVKGADLSKIDFNSTNRYTIGDASEITLAAVDGTTETAGMPVVHQFATAAKAAPTVDGGLKFAIPYGYSASYPVKFTTPLTYDGEIGKFLITMNCDLSTAAASYGMYGGGAIWGTKGIFIYPLGSTGASGEGFLIPFTITQRQDVTLEISSGALEGFLNADGKIEGFSIGACIGSSLNTLGSTDVLKNGATILVKSVAVDEKEYPTTDALDLTNSANYVIGAKNKLDAIAGRTEHNPDAGGSTTFSKNYVLPTATANGVKFAIGEGFTNNASIAFNEQILVEEGDTLYITLNADLSTLDWSWGHANGGYPNAGWGGDILIYPMNATGVVGEGVSVPYLITQRQDITFAISGSKLEEFVDNGRVKGILIASSIANFTSQGWKDALKGGASITVSYVGTVNPTETLESTDFVNGKATLFDANGGYVTTGDPAKKSNGVTESTHGGYNKAFLYDNINTLSMANDGAYFSFADMKAGSNDGYALAMEFNAWGLSSYPVIKFDKAVNVEDVCSLSFRIYANLNDNSVKGYGGGNPETGYFDNTGTNGGIWIYGANANYEKDEGILLNPNVKQREWTELTFTGADLAKLADSNGYISGFTWTSFIIADNTKEYHQFYQDGQAGWANGANASGKDKYDRVASIFIDEITVVSADTHVEGDLIVDSEGTCSQKEIGHTECIYCGETVRTNVEGNLDPSKHNCGELTQEIPAKIGVAGVKAHKQCADCEKYFDAEGNELDSLVIEPLLGVKQASISTSGDIGLNFVVYLGDVDSASATFTVAGNTTEPVAGVAEGEGFFKFSYGVAPKDYKKVVTISVVDTDIEFSYSVEQYALDLEDQDPTNAAMPLVNALIDYAESARAFFAEESVVATEDLTADLTAYKSQKVGEDAAVTILNASLVVEDLTTIKIYFETADISAIDVKVDGEDVEAIKVDGEENLYVVEIANIVAKDLNKAYAVTIGGYTVTYSALSYVQAILALDIDDVALNNVVKAIYNAWVAADAFFNA